MVSLDVLRTSQVGTHEEAQAEERTAAAVAAAVDDKGGADRRRQLGGGGISGVLPASHPLSINFPFEQIVRDYPVNDPFFTRAYFPDLVMERVEVRLCLYCSIQGEWEQGAHWMRRPEGGGLSSSLFSYSVPSLPFPACPLKPLAPSGV